jgi:transcriptional regulator with XRE-family HTH domain
VAEGHPNYELVSGRLRKARSQRRLSLRKAADEVGVSPATLSRIERQAGVPDLPTLDRLIQWLELDRASVLSSEAPTATDTPEAVDVLLRADPKLDPKTARALAAVFRSAYQELSRE